LRSTTRTSRQSCLSSATCTSGYGYVWVPPSEIFMVHRCIMGLKMPVSHSGETQAPYHTSTAHSHETVPSHRLIHPRHGSRVGSHAHRLLLFPAEGQLYSGQSRCSGFNSRQHLVCRGDVVFGQSDVTFTFRHSKTNQFNARVHRTVRCTRHIPSHLLDPVRALA
jgi:hypothetical protein